jgi:hypothetical protein
MVSSEVEFNGEKVLFGPINDKGTHFFSEKTGFGSIVVHGDGQRSDRGFASIAIEKISDGFNGIIDPYPKNVRVALPIDERIVVTALTQANDFRNNGWQADLMAGPLR